MESLVIKGFQQGTDLTTLAKSLKIPTNPGFDEVIEVEDNVRSIRLKNINLQILGPTKKILKNSGKNGMIGLLRNCKLERPNLDWHKFWIIVFLIWLA